MSAKRFRSRFVSSAAACSAVLVREHNASRPSAASESAIPGRCLGRPVRRNARHYRAARTSCERREVSGKRTSGEVMTPRAHGGQS
jgi:hypothetical protein